MCKSFFKTICKYPDLNKITIYVMKIAIQVQINDEILKPFFNQK